MVSGGIIASVSGLTGSLSNVTAVVDGYKLTLTGIANKTYTASKDTYVDLLRSGTTLSVVYTEVTNNAASPALASNSIRIGIVVSSGAALTTLNQGSPSVTAPVASSVVYAVQDSLGNLIYNTTPSPTQIGYRQIASVFSSGSTSPVQVTGLSCPVIIPAGRKAKISIVTTNTTINAVATSTVGIWDGTVGSGTRITIAGGSSAVSGASANPSPSGYVQPSLSAASSKTYNAAFNVDSGTGNFGTSASATSPSYISVDLV